MSHTRTRTLFELPCCAASMGTLGNDAATPVIAIEITFTDGKAQRALHGKGGAGYLLSAQLYLKETFEGRDFRSLVAGKGVTVMLQQSGRFHPGTLAKISPSSDHVYNLIAAGQQQYGWQFTEAGVAQLKRWLADPQGNAG